MNGIVVLGGHVQGLGIVRILGKLGHPVIVMDSTPSNIARHSKYCKKFIKFNAGCLLDDLIKIGESEKYKNYILFPTNDLYVSILSKNKVVLSKYFILAVDEWHVVEKTYNKRLTYNIARQIDVPIADTLMPDSIEEINNMDIKYPCVIKPAVMHSFYSVLKKKVFLCNNKDELVSNYQKAMTVIPPNEIIIQSVIQSETDGLYSACFLFNRKEAIQYFVGRRARQHPPYFGNATTFAQIVENDELVKLGFKILSYIGYTGVCEVEFMYDKNDNQYKFLEINPRTWKWHSISTKANINLLENYVNLLTNRELNVSTDTFPASFRHLVTDIPTIFKYKKLKMFKKYPKFPTQYAVLDKADLKPFLYELIYLPFNTLRR